MSQKNLIANRYEVIQHIGQGGMADVFLAIDTILNRHVAVKILRADLSSDAVNILRFEREAQAATALAHPNIVEVYDVGDYKGHHYIVMEYVEGKTLKKVIRERGPLMNEEAIDIMKQLVSAISQAHRKGIIHRDIKPQNVIVKADGSIKILDFGIATAKGSMQLTQANNILGSVHYLAPELARGEPASAQSDIYALGIVLFEMLAGDVPFKGEQPVEIAFKHIKEPLPNVCMLNPMVPQAVENIILRATAKNPSDRYVSAADMLQDLSTCLLPERAEEKRIADKPYKDRNLFDGMSFEEGHPKEDDDYEDDTTERKFRKKRDRNNKPRSKKKLVISLIVVIALAIALFFGSFFGFFGIVSREVAVPDLTGLNIEQAEELLTENHLVLDTVNITYELTTDTEKGFVIASDPTVETVVSNGSTVQIVVSNGIGVKMQNYAGSNIQSAKEALSKYAFLTIETVEEESDVPSGTILRQEGIEANQLFDPKTTSTIKLVYSAYETIVIPYSIIGMNYNDAAATLESMGVRAYASEIDPSTLTHDELIQIRDNDLVGTVRYSNPETGSEYTQKESNYITLFYYSFLDMQETKVVEENEE